MDDKVDKKVEEIRHNLRFTIYDLRFTIYDLRFTIDDLRMNYVLVWVNAETG